MSLSPPFFLSLRAWVFLLALLLQMIRSLVFFELSHADRNFQAQMAINLWQGQGLSLAHLDETDLSRVYYQTEANWPPGYSILLMPFYALTGKPLLSILGVHLLGILAMFWGLHKLVDPHLSTPAYVFLFGVWGISFSPFHLLSSTDIWAFACLVGSFYLLTQDNGRHRIELAFALLALAVLMRYAYYPLLLLPAWTMFWAEKKWDRSCSWALGGGIFLGLGIYLWQQTLAQGVPYFTLRPYVATDAWFFPQHWLRTDNFPLKAFCYIHPPQIATYLGLGAGWIKVLLWLPSWGILALAGAYGWQAWRRDRIWAHALAWIVAACVGSLFFLSLITPLEDWGEGRTWTYVEESRYFLPLMVALQVWVCAGAWPRYAQPALAPPIRRLLRLWLIGCLVFASVHTAYRVFEYEEAAHRRLSLFSPFQQDLEALYTRLQPAPTDSLPRLYVHGDWYQHVWEEPLIRAGIVSWTGAGTWNRDQSTIAHPWFSQPVRLFLHGPLDHVEASRQQLSLPSLPPPGDTLLGQPIWELYMPASVRK